MNKADQAARNFDRLYHGKQNIRRWRRLMYWSMIINKLTIREYEQYHHEQSLMHFHADFDE